MPSANPWKKGVRFAAQSDVGLRRSNNQDSFIVRVAPNAKRWLEIGHLFVVADGMGAHVAGEIASRLAVETVAKSYTNHTEPSVRHITKALYDAHQAVKQRGKQDAYRSMGTTCDAFALTPQGLIIGHVGDSRVYRLRGSKLEQLTFDHSLVWEVCMMTNSPLDSPPQYIPKNQITRSLGPTDNLVVDGEGPLPIEIGDIFLACSDGLSGQVKDEEIGQILSIFPPDTAIETLINLANLRGGPDNITVVIAEALDDPKEAEAVHQAMTVPLWHWSLLGITAAALCGAAGSIFADHSFLIMVFSVLTVVSFTAFFSLTRSALFGASPFQPKPPSGKGPYRSWDARPAEPFAKTFLITLSELIHVIKIRQFSVLLHAAERSQTQAAAQLAQGDCAGCIRTISLAVNLLMRDLKKIRNTQ